MKFKLLLATHIDGEAHLLSEFLPSDPILKPDEMDASSGVSRSFFVILIMALFPSRPA
jgi:hypothetical protein